MWNIFFRWLFTLIWIWRLNCPPRIKEDCYLNYLSFILKFSTQLLYNKLPSLCTKETFLCTCLSTSFQLEINKQTYETGMVLNTSKVKTFIKIGDLPTCPIGYLPTCPIGDLPTCPIGDILETCLPWGMSVSHGSPKGFRW